MVGRWGDQQAAVYETTFDLHFDRWSNSLGHFSVASSNPKVSSMYAKWFLGYDLLNTAVVEDDVGLCNGCHIHKTTCMSSELAAFLQLQTCIRRENVLSASIIVKLFV